MHLALLLLACATASNPPAANTAPAVDPHAPAALPPVGPGQAAAVVAGGCFWCMESDFDKLPGVVATTSGYAGGTLANPTYEDVNTETTGHKEAVRVVYDTTRLSYDQVLDYYWRHVDPTDDGGQFCDRGDSYRTGVYALDDAQLQAAQASKAALVASGVLQAPVVTELKKIDVFWAAENYHQDFHDTTPARYLPYRAGCGRDARVEKVWAGAKP